MRKFIRNTIAGVGMFLGTVLPSFAQDYTLSGKVRELERTTGAPMTAVKIDVDSSSFIAFTDANGNYSIAGIPSGVHNIRVSKPGFIGMFKKNYALDGNKTFNVSLADTIQESPQGTQVLKLDEFRELPPFTTYKGLNRAGSTAYPSENCSTWNGITEGNLIPVLLLNATAYDSLQFKNAIGACNGDWTQSPAGSVEKEQKRALYLLSNDPQISYTKRGMRVTFHAGSTRSSIIEYESDSPYILKAETTLASDIIAIIKKEVQGRNWSKQDIRALPLGRASYMNGNPADMTDLDHMINIVFYNQWAAIGRSEQNANILDMEKTPAYGIPLTPSIKNPQNNATDLDLLVKFMCDNEFGAEGYRWQVATDNTFNNKIIDAKALRIDTVMTLPENMTLYARVVAESRKGNSGYSSIIQISTKKPANRAPGAFSNVSPIGEIDSHVDNTFKWRKSIDPDGDIVKYKAIIIGANFNKTIENITDTLYTVLAGTLPGHKALSWKIIATDGTLETETNNTNINTKNYAPGTFSNVSPIGEIDSHVDNTFKWRKSIDPDGDIVKYKAIIIGANFNKTIENITDTLYTVLAGTLPGHKALSWKIIATDGTLETETNNTNINTKNYAPGTFSNVSPIGEIDSHVDNTFKWRKSIDPDGDIVKYKAIIIGANFNKTIENITDTLYTVLAGTLPGHKALSWKIIATDGTLETETNNTNINTKNYAPSKSTIILPNGAEVIDHSKPLSIEYTLSTDPDNDPVTYNIRIWNASKDTTIFGINNTAYILPAGFLKAGLSNSIKVTSTDGNLFTDSDIKTFNTITGIEDVIVGSEYKIYPNPCLEQIKLEYTLKQKATITNRIYDVTGRLEQEIIEPEQYPGTYTKDINMGQYKTGIHFIQTEIKTSDNQIYKKTGKIIKK